MRDARNGKLVLDRISTVSTFAFFSLFFHIWFSFIKNRHLSFRISLRIYCVGWSMFSSAWLHRSDPDLFDVRIEYIVVNVKWHVICQCQMNLCRCFLFVCLVMYGCLQRNHQSHSCIMNRTLQHTNNENAHDRTAHQWKIAWSSIFFSVL